MVTEHTVELAWDDTSFNELGFHIERRVLGEEDFIQVAEVPSDTNSYTDEDLVSATSYEYRVYAHNRNSVSDYSNITEGTTLTPSEPPTAPDERPVGR